MKLKKKSNSQACCYIIFNVLHNTIHHFENSVIYINIEIHCMLNIIVFPSFSFLLGACLNENNYIRSRISEIRENRENALVIRLSTEHVGTFKQWNMTQKHLNAKLCSTFLILKSFSG